MEPTPTKIYSKEPATSIWKHLSAGFSGLKELLHLTRHSAICKAFGKSAKFTSSIQKWQSLLSCYFWVLHFFHIGNMLHGVIKIRKREKYRFISVQFPNNCFLTVVFFLGITLNAGNDFLPFRKNYLSFI